MWVTTARALVKTAPCAANVARCGVSPPIRPPVCGARPPCSAARDVWSYWIPSSTTITTLRLPRPAAALAWNLVAARQLAGGVLEFAAADMAILRQHERQHRSRLAVELQARGPDRRRTQARNGLASTESGQCNRQRHYNAQAKMPRIIGRRGRPAEHRAEECKCRHTGHQQDRRRAGHAGEIDDDDPGCVERIAHQRPQLHWQDLGPRPDQPARIHHGPRADRRRQDQDAANDALGRPAVANQRPKQRQTHEDSDIAENPRWVFTQQSAPLGMKELGRQIAEQSREDDHAARARRRHSHTPAGHTHTSTRPSAILTRFSVMTRA